MLATWIVLTLLFGGSLYIWYQLILRWKRGEPFLQSEPRAQWNSAVEFAVLYVALLCMMPSLWNQFREAPAEEPSLPSRALIATQVAINLGLSLALPLTLFSATRPLSSFGISLANLSDQLRVGVAGFFAAVLPMAASLLLTAALRGKDTQHLLLKSLVATEDVQMILLIVLLAAFSVPFFEELLYRVILQGWLSTLLPAPAAISLTAVLFCFVHGWKNGLALLPLALILGYVFHRRHSYLAVVVIHALHNATMLLLQRLNPL